MTPPMMARPNFKAPWPMPTLGTSCAEGHEYSYQLSEPYYVQAGTSLTVTHKVTGKWDLKATGGRYRLTYRSAGTVLVRGRRDLVRMFGGGIGYTLGGNSRVGFDVVRYHRESDV